MKMAGNVDRMGKTNVHLVRKHLGKYLLGRLRRKWTDDIEMDCRETDCEDKRWVELSQHHFQWQVKVKLFLCLIN
jgi:hypothetical protein